MLNLVRESPLGETVIVEKPGQGGPPTVSGQLGPLGPPNCYHNFVLAMKSPLPLLLQFYFLDFTIFIKV